MGVDLMNRAAGPLTGRARILARRKDVPSLQTYSDHSIDKHARLREQSRGRGNGDAIPPSPPLQSCVRFAGLARNRQQSSRRLRQETLDQNTRVSTASLIFRPASRRHYFWSGFRKAPFLLAINKCC